MNFVLWPHDSIAVVKARRPLKSCILVVMSRRFEVPKELQRLFKLLDYQFLLLWGKHVLMIFVTFLHWLDFVSLSGSFRVSNNCVFNPLLNYRSRQIVYTEQEFKGGFESLLRFIL